MESVLKSVTTLSKIFVGILCFENRLAVGVRQGLQEPSCNDLMT